MTERTHKRTIYLVGAVLPGSSGGFEWRETRPEAEQARTGSFDPAAELVTPVRAVQVPADLDSEAVTDWLDARPELWEPAVRDAIDKGKGGDDG